MAYEHQALPPPQYPPHSPVQQYNPDIGQVNAGGYVVNKDPYCNKVKKVVFKNKCETKQFKNCTEVIKTNVESVLQC